MQACVSLSAGLGSTQVPPVHVQVRTRVCVEFEHADHAPQLVQVHVPGATVHVCDSTGVPVHPVGVALVTVRVCVPLVQGPQVE